MTDEIAAIDWFNEHMQANSGVLSILGYRWLRNAQRHLEDRVDTELRRSNGA